MTTYISKQAMPGAPKGTDWFLGNYGKYITNLFSELSFSSGFILAHPDWWTEKKQETLEEVNHNKIKKMAQSIIDLINSKEND